MQKKKSFSKKVKQYFTKLISAKIAPNIVLSPLRIFLYKLCGYKIGKNVFIGMRCYLDDVHPEMLTIEDNCVISYGVYFSTHGAKQRFGATPITIKNGAYIGMRSTIVSGKNGITIGEKAVVGASTLVNKDIPAGATAVGVPCRILSE